MNAIPDAKPKQQTLFLFSTKYFLAPRSKGTSSCFVRCQKSWSVNKLASRNNMATSTCKQHKDWGLLCLNQWPLSLLFWCSQNIFLHKSLSDWEYIFLSFWLSFPLHNTLRRHQIFYRAFLKCKCLVTVIPSQIFRTTGLYTRIWASICADKSYLVW